jgi:hypothetical protein
MVLVLQVKDLKLNINYTVERNNEHDYKKKINSITGK